MSLLNNILEWTQTLPRWQQDACRRLFQCKNGLLENDYAQLYDLLKIEHDLPNLKKLTPNPLASAHLPAMIQPGETVTLKDIHELKHVNRIALNQTLALNETGMSVIYGGNGTGKSGYVRVMKQACRCRDQDETVHANAKDLISDTLVPEAKFKIIKQGKDEVVIWKRGGTSPEVLSMISVFDSRCARSYLTTEYDVAYLPYGLDIIENLAREVIPELEKRLTQEIDSIDTDIKVISHLLGETKVGKQISKLSEKTNKNIIKELGTLSKNEVERLSELNKALAEADPIAKANELKRFASRLKNLEKDINELTLSVNDDAVQKLKALDDEVVGAEDAEKKAAQVLQSGEALLPGTGEQLWKTLFEAARKYSTQIACPEHEFPHTGVDAVCPLCQTSLDNESGKRLERFEQYIKNDVAKLANAKRENLNTIRQKIEEKHFVIAMDKNLEIEIDQYDDKIVQCIANYQKSINKKRQSMLGALETHKWDSLVPLADNPRLALHKLAGDKLIEARTFIKASNEAKKKLLSQEYNELIARQSLKKSLQSVLDLIERKKKVAGLKVCEKNLNTAPISNKSKEFASEAVTKELKSALDIEFKNLGVERIETKLKEKSIRGKMHHQLLLELPTNKPLNEILSEGEQRAIALGAFLAELSLANHSCGIVFDDPVSSLDHWRRENVARRLVEEAQKRQVIVFTHDTSFLGQIREEIRTQGLDHKIQHLEWEGDYSGCVREGLPWGHSSYKERIETLEKKHRELEKKWPQYPSSEDTGKMRTAYNELRKTIERVIQDVVFCGVIERYRDWIRIRDLKGVVGFEDTECDKIERLYQRCSGIGPHDPSSAKNNSVPTPVDLAEDIKNLKDIIKTIEDRRKAKKAAAP